MADEVQFKSFSRPRPKIEFGAGPDDEHFEAYPVMPPVMLQELVNIIRNVRTAGDIDNEDKMTATLGMLNEFFSLVLKDESYTRFQKKMANKESGVQIDEIMDIFNWMIEQYGLRPTSSSSSSSAGSPSGDDGNSSTDGALPVVSVP